MITMSFREGFSLLVFGLLLLCRLRPGDAAAGRLRLGQDLQAGRKSELFVRRYLVLHAVAAVGHRLMLYGYFIEPNWIDVHMTTVPTPKLKTARFRLVQITDLHCDWKIRNEEEMVRIINDLKPDIVVATGDYLNHRSALPHLQDCSPAAGSPPGQIRRDRQLGRPSLAAARCAGWHGFSLASAGHGLCAPRAPTVSVSTAWISLVPMPPSGPIQSLPADRFNVFLFHTPDLIEDVCGPSVDLYLCGHTHGGQVCLPWYGALITFSKFGKKYESGLYRVGETMLYVNRGLGLEQRPGPQVRFLAGRKSPCSTLCRSNDGCSPDERWSCQKHQWNF